MSVSRLMLLGAAGVQKGNPWDVSQATFVRSFSVVSQETFPNGLFFKPDGTKMFIVGEDGDEVNEYSLSSAWDISTASYVQTKSISAQESLASDLSFKPDGTKMYVLGDSGNDVNEYSLSSAWDVSTASFVQAKSVSAQESSPSGLFFKPDGTKMYVVGNANDTVYEYNLSSAWDVSTASYLQGKSVSAQASFPGSLFFKDDGTKMYVGAYLASPDRIFEYDLSSAWDVSTATYLQAFDVSGQSERPLGLYFSDDGLNMYIVGSLTDSVYQYRL